MGKFCSKLEDFCLGKKDAQKGQEDYIYVPYYDDGQPQQAGGMQGQPGQAPTPAPVGYPPSPQPVAASHLLPSPQTPLGQGQAAPQGNNLQMIPLMRAVKQPQPPPPPPPPPSPVPLMAVPIPRPMPMPNANAGAIQQGGGMARCPHGRSYTSRNASSSFPSTAGPACMDCLRYYGTTSYSGSSYGGR